MFFKDFLNLFGRETSEQEWEGEGKADSLLSRDPNVGLIVGLLAS